MIQIEHVRVYNFEGAIRGMRNPLNSWDKSDSNWELDCNEDEAQIVYEVGDNDINLMRKLCAAGPEHRKYLRQIIVCLDIVAPFYWWKEFDTYKVGVTSDSCSTMHTIHRKEIELSDFSFDDVRTDDDELDVSVCFNNVTADCELLRKKYLETKDSKYWRALIQLLPSAYNQRRTITLNYENVINMIRQRANHKLSEWRELCATFMTLPYVAEILKLPADELDSATEIEMLKNQIAELTHVIEELKSSNSNDIQGGGIDK